MFCGHSLNTELGGHGAYHQKIPSDHVHLWADFKLEDILGVRPTIPKIKAVTLQASLPPSRNNHNENSWKRIHKDKSVEALEAPMEIPKELLKDHHKKRHNEILAKATKICLQEAKRA